MLSSYSYRVIKSSWGISIDIVGEYTSMSTYNDNDKSFCQVVNSGLWLIVKDNNLSKNELKYLIDGLKMVSDLITSKSLYKNDTLVIISSVSYSLCDYQEEGLTPAVIKWAANMFNFEAPRKLVSFNKETNKYEFTY